MIYSTTTATGIPLEKNFPCKTMYISQVCVYNLVYIFVKFCSLHVE